jgi:hypothetical protein
MNFWQAMSMGSFLLAWYSRASADGKITQQEVLDGVREALMVAGVNIEIEVPAAPAPPVPAAPATRYHESGATYRGGTDAAGRRAGDAASSPTELAGR